MNYRLGNFFFLCGHMIELVCIIYPSLISLILLSYLLCPGICKQCWNFSSKFMETLLSTFMKMVSLSLSLSLSHTHTHTHTKLVAPLTMTHLFVSLFFFFLFFYLNFSFGSWLLEETLNSGTARKLCKLIDHIQICSPLLNEVSIDESFRTSK